MAEVQIKEVNYRHQAIVDWMLLNPDKGLKEMSRALGFTVPWLSVIKRSDAFQAYYQARREMHEEHLSAASIDQKLGVVAELALDTVITRINNGDMGNKDLNAITKTTLSALGYGSETPVVSHSHQHVHVTSIALREARDMLRHQELEVAVGT